MDLVDRNGQRKWTDGQQWTAKIVKMDRLDNIMEWTRDRWTWGDGSKSVLK